MIAALFRHRIRFVAPVVLVAGIVAAYWNSLPSPFLFDDAGAVLRNPTIHSLGSAWMPPTDGSATTGRPVVNVSFALNHAIGGESVRGYRATNVLIHTFAALILMGLVRRTLELPSLRERFGAVAKPAAFVMALIWGLHPLHTESVVCIAQRTELLGGLFFLLTFYGFVRAVEDQPRAMIWRSLSVGACLAGMGSKEILVMAPLLVWFYDRTFVAGTFAGAWRRRWRYYAALACAYTLLLALVIAGRGTRGASAGFGLGVSWWPYLLTQAEAIVLYLRLALWPHPLVLDYGTPVVSSIAEVWWQGLVVLALLGGTLWAIIRRSAAAFCGVWFFAILAPSSSVLPLVTQTMAEHRMYLPLIAVLGIAVPLLFLHLPKPARGLFLVVAVAAGLATVDRNRDYRDALAIWSATVADAPANPRAHNNLALALQEAGTVAQANEHFARAVELDPGYVWARYNWGTSLLEEGRLDEALVQLEEAVRLAPDHADARLNLGNALVRSGRVSEAVEQYEGVLRLRPEPDALFNLGVAYFDAGQDERAAARFRSALRMDPDLPDAHVYLGRLSERRGEAASAAEARFREALRLRPGHPEATRRLAMLLARDGRYGEAAQWFRALTRIAPNDAEAHANLGNSLLVQGLAREAISSYEEALRLRPDDARMQENIRIAREIERQSR